MKIFRVVSVFRCSKRISPLPALLTHYITIRFQTKMSSGQRQSLPEGLNYMAGEQPEIDAAGNKNLSEQEKV